MLAKTEFRDDLCFVIDQHINPCQTDPLQSPQKPQSYPISKNQHYFSIVSFLLLVPIHANHPL